MPDLDLDAIREAEIKAGLNWTLENAHPLLMAIGPLVDEVRRTRAQGAVGASKGCFLTTTQLFRLNNAVRPLRKLVGAEIGGIFLVGSAGERPDFRDVDVRLILRDERFDELFPDPQLWALFCYAWSRTLSADTELPIDFQVQRQTEANAKHDGPRNPLASNARDFAGLGDATPYYEPKKESVDA